jgi:RNA polymerase sigma factor (sigma-70 family)
MTGTAARRQAEPRAFRSDERLIAQCLEGDQQAWAELIDKYKNLIYSIPVKLGMYQDAADIFQAVCVDLMSELSRLREHRALPKWLMQTCYHKCLHQRKAADRQVQLEAQDWSKLDAGNGPDLPEQMLANLEKEQALRAAVVDLPQRCQRMIQMLFFEGSPRPYQEVARELGLATGSIGFIRGRCLARLRRYLQKKGFR